MESYGGKRICNIRLLHCYSGDASPVLSFNVSIYVSTITDLKHLSDLSLLVTTPIKIMLRYAGSVTMYSLYSSYMSWSYSVYIKFEKLMQTSLSVDRQQYGFLPNKGFGILNLIYNSWHCIVLFYKCTIKNSFWNQ